MAKQERRIFDKDVQVWVHRYENLRNMAHWHFENELVVCQEGAAEIMLDGIFYTLHQGDCAFFCGERVHNIRGTVDSRIAVAQFGNLLHSPCYLKKPIFPDRYNACERMNELNAEYQKKQLFYAEKMNALITSLLSDIFRGCCFSKRMRKLFRKNEKSVLRFCNKSSKTKRAFTKVLMPCKRPF